MSDRKRWRAWLPAMGAAITLWVAAPVLAQESEGGGISAVSYASRFLSTDNVLGTSLVWFCLLISVAIVALILQNLLQNRPSVFMPPDLVEGLDRLLAEKNYREAIDLVSSDPSPFAQAMRAAMNEAPRGFMAMEEALEEAADNISNRKVRSLIWLEVAGAAGPMIGLFGTVFGMILSFQQLVSLGGQPKPAELAGGIATALVCTFWGLVVGIPGVIAAALFRVRVEGLTAEVVGRSKEMLTAFRPAKKTAAPATSPKPAPAAT